MTEQEKQELEKQRDQKQIREMFERKGQDVKLQGAVLKNAVKNEFKKLTK
jgi:hypothetical protein